MSDHAPQATITFKCEATRERHLNDMRPDEPPTTIYTVRELAVNGGRLRLSGRHSTAPAFERRKEFPHIYPDYRREALGNVAITTSMDPAMAARLMELSSQNLTDRTLPHYPRKPDINCHGFAAHLLGNAPWDSDQAERLFNFSGRVSASEKPADITGYSIWIDESRPALHTYLYLPKARGINRPLSLNILGNGGLLALCPVNELHQGYAGSNRITRRRIESVNTH